MLLMHKGIYRYMHRGRFRGGGGGGGALGSKDPPLAPSNE